MKISLILVMSLLALLVFGCVTSQPRETASLEELHSTIIPSIKLNKATLDESIAELRQLFLKETGKQMPLVELYEAYGIDEATGETEPYSVTFRAHHISAYEAVDIIASISNTRLRLKNKNAVITDIRPYEYLGIQLPWTADLASALGVATNASAASLTNALASRGVDFTNGYLRVTLHEPTGYLFLNGYTENTAVARGIIELLTRGYEVIKKDKEEQPLSYETNVIETVDLREVTIRQALDQAGLTNRISPKVLVFKESAVTNRITFSASKIPVGEFVEILASVGKLELIRDYSSQSIILIPWEVGDGRLARAFTVFPDIYNSILGSNESFGDLLVSVGVIRQKTHMLYEYQPEYSTLILYGSAEAMRRVDMTFTSINVKPTKSDTDAALKEVERLAKEDKRKNADLRKELEKLKERQNQIIAEFSERKQITDVTTPPESEGIESIAKTYASCKSPDEKKALVTQMMEDNTLHQGMDLDVVAKMFGDDYLHIGESHGKMVAFVHFSPPISVPARSDGLIASGGFTGWYLQIWYKEFPEHNAKIVTHYALSNRHK